MTMMIMLAIASAGMNPRDPPVWEELLNVKEEFVTLEEFVTDKDEEELGPSA